MESSRRNEPPRTSNELLIRIDERTQNLIREVQEINEKVDKSFVKKEEFEPIRRIVYGMVGLVLLSVFGAVLALVLKKA